MNSLWSNTANSQSFIKLERDINTDVLIIGGGITGILTAYRLQELGIDYILLEADHIGNGVTKNTTAKISANHTLIYSHLLKERGRDIAGLYLASNLEAQKRYKMLCENIDCDLEQKNSYIYSTDNSQLIRDEVSALKSIGYNAKFIKKLPLPFHIEGAVEFNDEAQFHPLKFINAISKNLNIYENSRVIDFKNNTACTRHGKVTAKKTVVCTHFPFINRHGSYFLKMFQHRSYVLAIENAQDVQGMYLEAGSEGISLRNYKDLLLIGGGGHRTGEDGGNWDFLSQFAKKHFPDSSIKYRWATQDCMSLDRIPYIGQYSKNTENLFVATGFNKWGMTLSMAASMLIGDLLSGKPNRYKELFSPSRNMICKQLFVNIGKSAMNLLTPTVPRCPHMGCALKYNIQEHSWDCPCHGSRFSDSGELLDNPAKSKIFRSSNN